MSTRSRFSVLQRGRDPKVTEGLNCSTLSSSRSMLQRGRDPKVTEGSSGDGFYANCSNALQRGRDPKVTEGAQGGARAGVDVLASTGP